MKLYGSRYTGMFSRQMCCFLPVPFCLEGGGWCPGIWCLSSPGLWTWHGERVLLRLCRLSRCERRRLDYPELLTLTSCDSLLLGGGDFDLGLFCY